MEHFGICDLEEKNIDFVDRELKCFQQHKLFQKRFHKLQEKKN